MSAHTDAVLERLLSEVETLKESVLKLHLEQQDLVARFETEGARVNKLQKAAEKLVTKTKQLVAGVEALVSSS